MRVEQTVREEQQFTLRAEVVASATDEAQAVINGALLCAIAELKSRLMLNGGTMYPTHISDSDRQHGQALADLVCESLANDLPCDIAAMVKDQDEYDAIENIDGVIDAVASNVAHMLKK